MGNEIQNFVLRATSICGENDIHILWQCPPPNRQTIIQIGREIEGVSDVASVDLVWVVNKFESDVVSDIALDVTVESATDKPEGDTPFGHKGVPQFLHNRLGFRDTRFGCLQLVNRQRCRSAGV
jgi:hypothetical protein